jgi:hypothetical protein
MDKTSFSYWEQILSDEWWMQTMAMIHKGKDVKQAALESFGDLINDPIRLERMDHGDFKKYVNRWLSNKPFPKKVTQKILHDLK